jgi:hypothetical protein
MVPVVASRLTVTSLSAKALCFGLNLCMLGSRIATAIQALGAFLLFERRSVSVPGRLFHHGLS